MAEIVWSEPALANVQRLYRFLVTKNPAAAQRAGGGIREGVGILAGQPQVGRVHGYMEEAFRDWPIQFGDSGYVVRYRFDGDQVTILTVRHQREAGFKATD